MDASENKVISPGRYAAEFTRRAASESILDVSERKPNEELPEGGEYVCWQAYARLDIDRYQESISNYIDLHNPFYKKGTRMLISVDGPISPEPTISIGGMSISKIGGTWGGLKMWIDKKGRVIADPPEGSDLVVTTDNANTFISKKEFVDEFIETVASKYGISVSALGKHEVSPAKRGCEEYKRCVFLKKDAYKAAIHAISLPLRFYPRHIKVSIECSGTSVPEHTGPYADLTMFVDTSSVKFDIKQARELYMMNALLKHDT